MSEEKLFREEHRLLQTKLDFYLWSPRFFSCLAYLLDSNVEVRVCPPYSGKLFFYKMSALNGGVKCTVYLPPSRSTRTVHRNDRSGKPERVSDS